MIKLPCLLDANMKAVTPLRPLAYSLIDNLTPLSTASLTLESSDAVHMRDFVEIFTEDGSAGIFRVNNIRHVGCQVLELSLQHGLCTLSDHMHPGESTQTGSCRTLLTKILSNQTRWVLGTVDVSDDQEMTWECNNTNDLQGLLAIMKELPGYCLDFDMMAMPWLLHVRAKSSEVECEARFDRNLTDVQVEYDDTDMCTLAYADGLAAPIKADTFDTWYEIARHVSVDEDLGVDVITQTVKRYLEQTKNPRVTITLTAIELSRLTGEPFDHFRKGMLCRCILPEMTAIQRIVSIEHPDPIGDPANVILTLASTQNDLSVTVAGLVVDTRHVNQLVQQLEKNLRIEADTIDMLAAEIDLLATKAEVDGVSTRIAEAEIALNEILGQLELRVTYTDFQTSLNEVSVLLDAVEAELLLKASHSDLDDGLNEVSLRLDAQDNTIEMQAGEIFMKADKTYVDSLVAQYATIAELETLQAKVSDLEAGLGDFTVIDANVVNATDANLTFLSASSFTFAGSTISKRPISMGEVSSAGNVLSTGALDLQHSHTVTVNGDGTITLGEVSSSGGSFNIADTQFYKDGVSAAHTLGALENKPSNLSVNGTISGSRDYLLSVSLTNVYGNTIITFNNVAFDARDAYHNGYDDGYAAGYQAAIDDVRLDAAISSVSNTGPNTFHASGYARVFVGDTQVDYEPLSRTQTINVG